MCKKMMHLVMAAFAGLIFHHNVYAAFDTWDGVTPWGVATPDYYVGWNVWNSIPTDTTPDAAGSGTGFFQTYLNNANFFLNGNVTGAFNSNTNTAYNSALTNVSAVGTYDVYVRMEIIDTNAFTQANLNVNGSWVPTSSITSFINPNPNSAPTELELYWVWNNVAAPVNGNFFIKIAKDVLSSNGGNISISQYEIAAFSTTAVPEPETYIMLLIGFCFLYFVRRKRQYVL